MPTDQIKTNAATPLTTTCHGIGSADLSVAATRVAARRAALTDAYRSQSSTDAIKARSLLAVGDSDRQEIETGRQERKLIMRSIGRRGASYETTSLLFRGSGDYLEGFVMVSGVKRHVIVHWHQRKPDPVTGEVRPNFLTLSEPLGTGPTSRWKQIGHGHAINRPSDGKPVFFDEMLLTVCGQFITARITPHVDLALQRKLGFLKQRQDRDAWANHSALRPGLRDRWQALSTKC